MAVYRANIISIEAAANGTINADCFVELKVSLDPPVWQPTSQGHFTIVLAASEILAITDSAMTSSEKRVALKTLIKQKALERGVDSADEAYSAMTSLLTFPLEVLIR